jgi:2-hydroxychromene-2-carboxylate isomerase
LDVTLKPVLFAGLLGYWDNMGPAEIPARRRQTYRYCHWLAGKRGVPFKAASRRPFNPLTVLRLTLALESTPAAVHAIFRHIWGEGKDAQDPAVLAGLAESLGVDDLSACINDPAIKQQLHDNTDEAVRRGVFGIPSFVVNDEVFWGDDLTDMFLEYLENLALLKHGDMGRLANLPTAARRKESRL